MKSLMFGDPGIVWEEWAVVLPCLMIWVSCLFYINHLDRKKDWVRKSVLFLFGLSALGILWGPFAGLYLAPSPFEIFFYWVVGVGFVKHTWCYWRELPCFDRRRKQAIFATDRRRGGC